MNLLFPEILISTKLYKHAFLIQCGYIDKMNIRVGDVKPKGDTEKTIFKKL